MTNLHRAQNSARVTLKVGRGLAALLAGRDKFFHLLVDWPGYRRPLALAVVPVSRSVSISGPDEPGVGAVQGVPMCSDPPLELRKQVPRLCLPASLACSTATGVVTCPVPLPRGLAAAAEESWC